jgi:hypothetical protein
MNSYNIIVIKTAKINDVIIIIIVIPSKLNKIINKTKQKTKNLLIERKTKQKEEMKIVKEII